MSPLCPPNKCRLKVNLKGESQDVSFEQPVDSVEFPDGRSTTSKKIKTGFWIGVSTGIGMSVIAIGSYLSLTNQHLCDLDYHRVISLESARRLNDQGITWDVELRRWVESKAPSVTNLSPKPLIIDK